MPNNDEQRAQTWRERIRHAHQLHNDWSREFAVRDLEDAYYGHQWHGESEEDWDSERKYVLNMIFNSIDVKSPALLFDNPIFTLKPKPSSSSFDPVLAGQMARLKTDVVNTLFSLNGRDYGQELELAILDAWFRFGVIECGYSADWVKNPHANKPYLKSDLKPVKNKEGEMVRQPDLLPENEQVYIKRVPAEDFIVGGITHPNINKCDWVGYQEIVPKEDLFAMQKARPDIYNKEALEGTISVDPADGIRLNDFHIDVDIHSDEYKTHRKTNGVESIKIYKIWDLRSREFLIFTEVFNEAFHAEPFERLPLKVMAFRPKTKGFYPVPPVFNWMSPQAEINEVRESNKINRRKNYRSYAVVEGEVEKDEIEKFVSGEDMTVIKVRSPNGIPVPIQDASNGKSHDQALVVSKDDFNLISATSAQQRQQSDRTTATQANIIEQRANVQESRDRTIVANFLKDIAYEVLKLARENLSAPIWIKSSLDHPSLFEQVQYNEQIWQKLSMLSLDDEDFTVDVKVSSLSPTDQQREKEQYVEFLTIISQFPQVTLSPAAVFATAEATGYRNERVIEDIAKTALLVQLGQLSQLGQALGVDPQQLDPNSFSRTSLRDASFEQQGNAFAQRQAAQLIPPDIEQINNQITNQVGA